MLDDKIKSLIPILPFQKGVCSLCHQGTPNTNQLCDTCSGQCATLGLEVNTFGRIRQIGTESKAIAGCMPISLRLDANAPYYSAFYEYKATQGIPLSNKTQAEMFIQLLIHAGLRHEKCFAKYLAIEKAKFDAITWIPSKRGREGVHPLGQILQKHDLSGRVVNLLSLNQEISNEIDSHSPRKDLWLVSGSEKLPRSVLVIDDTFTKGSSMLSCAYALLQAGVERIGLMPLARHMSQQGYSRSPNQEFEKFSSTLSWNENYCLFCDNREQMKSFPDLMTLYGSENWVINHEHLGTGTRVAEGSELRKGTVVQHKKFGRGVIFWVGEKLMAVDFSTGLITLPIENRDVDWL